MTLESLLTEISERGWKLNNLFQRDNGQWQANIRRDNFITEFGFANTPSEAISITIDKIETAIEVEQKKVSVFSGKTNFEKTPSGDFLAFREKLLGPKQTIKRRI